MMWARGAVARGFAPAVPIGCRDGTEAEGSLQER